MSRSQPDNAMAISEPRVVRLLKRSNADVVRLLVSQIRLASLPAPILSYPYEKGREGSTFELSWPSLRIAASFTDRCVHGWRVIRLTRRDVENGEALMLVQDALRNPPRTVWDEMQRIKESEGKANG